MNGAYAVMQAALAAKQRRRHELAALPYEEKLRILLRLQQMGDIIRQTRGVPARAWPIDEKTLMPVPTVSPPGVSRLKPGEVEPGCAD